MDTRHRNSQPFFTLRVWLRRGVHFVFDTLINPLTADEDSRRHEFVLNTILCCVIALMAILEIFIVRAEIQKGSSYDGVSWVVFSLLFLTFVALLALSRKGYYKASSFILLLLYFVATTYGAIEWTIWLPFVAISYVVVIIMASILVSTRFSLLVTVAAVITVTLVTWLQANHYVLPQVRWKYTWISMNEPIQLSIVLFLVAGISWLSNREMERSLKRARASEQALREERNLLEIKVEERTEQLKEMQKQKVSQLYRLAEFGKLSTGVFHDLMNSLNIVVNNVERLEVTPEHLPEVRDHMKKAVSASKRMGAYIQTVKKQLTVNDSEEIFSVQKEIQDAIDIVQFKARSASVQIEATITEDVFLHGNALRLYQAILNLLMNAIEACEENERESVVSISLSKTTSVVFITVTDNGCGMSEETMTKVYEPFFTTKTYGKGTGFGLSQTREIVEKLFKGTIAIKSILDKGTQFIISIPLYDEESHANN